MYGSANRLRQYAEQGDDDPGGMRLLLTTCCATLAVFLILFEPWIVCKRPHDWWLQWSPVWDAPFSAKVQPYLPYCPEGHGCFFIVGIELIALGLMYAFLKHRVRSEKLDRDDYSAYRRQRREARHRY